MARPERKFGRIVMKPPRRPVLHRAIPGREVPQQCQVARSSLMDCARHCRVTTRKAEKLFGERNQFRTRGRHSSPRWTAPVAGKRGYGAIVDAGDAVLLRTPTGTLPVFEPSP